MLAAVVVMFAVVCLIQINAQKRLRVMHENQVKLGDKLDRVTMLVCELVKEDEETTERQFSAS